MSGIPTFFITVFIIGTNFNYIIFRNNRVANQLTNNNTRNKNVNERKPPAQKKRPARSQNRRRSGTRRPNGK